MIPTNFSRWLGACALGSLLIVGCRHTRKCECEVICCECCEHVQPVPADPPKKKVAVEQLPAFDKEKEQVVIKRDERPAVAYRVVAPGMSAGSGDLVGTDEMTAADADKVQIRPGHTPGALWTSASRQPLPQMNAAETKVEPTEASENPSVPKMAIPQKPADGEPLPEMPQ
jgi:hypothetical protein